MLTQEEREFLDEVSRQPVSRDVAELRALVATLQPLRNGDLPEIGALHEEVVLGGGLTAEVAVPKAAGPHPVMVYMHGGGWVAGSPRSHRKLAMQFAEHGFLTITVDYRLAPEHPFPAGLEDCVFAIEWAAANAQRWDGDGTRIAVGGDSAGANLAAAALISLSSRVGAPTTVVPRAAVLIYGLYDFPASLVRSTDVLALEDMARTYACSGYPAILDDWRLSPLHAVRPGALPPSFIVCGTDDSLLAESQAMAEALVKAGIPHELHLFEEMPHGFLQMTNLSACVEAQRRMFEFLRRTT
jgi:acetyl esterase